MQPLDPRRLEAALAGRPALPDPTPALVDAWRVVHHAAQLASEVGKAWAPPRADDSHSSFEWREDALEGVAIPAPRRFRAALHVPSLELRLLDDADGAALAALPLEGETVASGLAWVRAQAARLAGEGPRQAAVPAPDLPPHPVAEGAPFARREPGAFAALAGLLAAADAVLRRIAGDLGAGPVRCWPHHLDLATLVPVRTAVDGSDAATIGLGLAVPDGLEPTGYWYVSPWRAGEAAPARWPALPHGRWVERGDALRLAALPLGELAREGAATRQHGAVAAFLAAAFAAARDALA
jgi:hypothetical protein